MAPPAEWDEAVDLLVQLVQENRSAADNAYRELFRELSRARDSLAAIRLDAIETGTAPFSPRKDFSTELAVDLILAAVPASKLLTVAATRSLSLASYMVRIAGEAPITKAAAAKAADIAWDLRLASTKLRSLLTSPFEGGKALAKEAGKKVTETAFKAVAKEAIETLADDEDEGPTGLIVVSFFDEVQSTLNVSAKMIDRALDNILDIARVIRKDDNEESNRALDGALTYLTAPRPIVGPFKNARDKAAAALGSFRAFRDSPDKLRVPTLPIARSLEAPLQEVAAAINAKELRLSSKLLAVALALTYEFFTVVVDEIPSTQYLMGEVPVYEALHFKRDKYLEVDDKVWKSIFTALGGSADVTEDRTKRLAKALGRARDVIVKQGR
jgi:hypothetical protein